VGTNLEAVYIVYTADGACAAFEDATNKFEPGSVRVQSGAHCYEDVCRLHTAPPYLPHTPFLGMNTLCSVQVHPSLYCTLSTILYFIQFVFDEKTKAVLQMSQLLDWGVDPERGYYLSSGDTNWGAFKKLFAKGKVLPGGSCYSVGLGGHISGGGDGILSRLNGITVDWLTGVEVVVKPTETEEAKLIYVSKDSTDTDHRDLWWAHTGGGGGNFGVITRCD